MIGLILSVIIGTIIALWCWHDSFGIDFGGIIISVLVGCLVGVCWALISVIPAYNASIEYYKIGETPILAIQDSQSVTGRFYAGYGYVNGELRYTYAYEEDGGVRISTLSSEKAILVENNENIKKIEYYKSRYKNKLINKLFIHFSEYQYKLYIPQKTIKYDYNVDMK